MVRLIFLSAAAVLSLCGTAELAMAQTASGANGMSGSSTAGAPGAQGASMPDSAQGAQNGSMTTSNGLPAPPADAMNRTYPPCTAQLQDACTNPGQAHAGGHRANRAAPD